MRTKTYIKTKGTTIVPDTRPQISVLYTHQYSNDEGRKVSTRNCVDTHQAWICGAIWEFCDRDLYQPHPSPESKTLGGGGGWGGGEGGAASWGGGAVDDGSVNAFLVAALTRVMRAAVPIPAVASASVLHSEGFGGSFVGVVGPL